MAKMWYAQEGDRSNIGGPRCELPLQRFEELFAQYAKKYLGIEPRKFPSDKPELDGIRDPRYVILEVTADDVANYKPERMGFHTSSKEGFYKVDVSILECESILKKQGM